MRIRVNGNLAMFVRPEMKTDICSYDMITPAAARGVMDSLLDVVVQNGCRQYTQDFIRLLRIRFLA